MKNKYKKTKKYKNKKITKKNKWNKITRKFRGGSDYFYQVNVDNFDNGKMNIYIHLYPSKKDRFDSYPLAHIALSKINDEIIYIIDLGARSKEKGYGGSLLKYTINYLREKTSYKLVTGFLSRVDDRRRLIDFYPRFGFSIIPPKSREEDWKIELNLENSYEKVEKINITDLNTEISTTSEFGKQEREYMNHKYGDDGETEYSDDE
jgi:hypothetical protein